MIVPKKASFTVRLILRLMEIRYKRTGETLLQMRHRTNAAYIPQKGYTSEQVDGVDVYSILRQNTDTHVFYLHGGAYVHYGDKLHFRFLAKLSKQANVSVHYIDYPLAGPSKTFSTFHQTTTKTIEVIGHLQQKYPGNYYVMGDSSGGGLALSIADQLSDINGFVLMSPWLDVSLSNPNIKQEDYTDGFYTKEDLQDCGSWYAPNEETNPLASPRYKDVLPDTDVIVFNGTADLLHLDIVQFEQTFPQVVVYQYVGAPHVFPLFPFSKEQKHFIQTFINHKKIR